MTAEPDAWGDSVEAKLNKFVDQAYGSDERYDALVKLLRAALHKLVKRGKSYENEKPPAITRLVDVPVVNGKHTYRCDYCGEKHRGNDRDRAHMQWTQKHWVECFGLTPQPHWWPKPN